MEIRNANISDIDRIMEIYAIARSFMAKSGNPRQWGSTNHPPRAMIEQDIASEKCYVCTENKHIVGVFYHDFGIDIDSTYRKFAYLTKGEPYGVVHRIASSGEVKGVGRFCLNYAYEKSGRLMIDTHPDNKVMQGLLSSLGFKNCGETNVPEDDDIRLVYIK